MTRPSIHNGRARRALVAVLVLVPYAAVGVLSVRAIGEGDRTHTAVTNGITAEQRRQATEQRRQAGEQERQGRALCSGWKQTAESKIQANASELGRSLVRTAADDYRLVHCERFAGPLGPVDPAAYEPAPKTPR